MIKMKTAVMILVLICAVAGVSFSAGQRAEGQPEFVFRASHGSAVTSTSHEFYTFFKEEVEKNSNGRIKVEIYPGASLAGGAREEIEMSQRGELTFSVVATSAIASFGVPSIQLLDLPFLFQDVDEAYEVMNNGEVFKDISKEIEQQGMIPLFYNPMGFQHLTSNFSIRTQSDFQRRGLKFRVMESEAQVRLWRALGANPTPMAWGELYTALEQGTIDSMVHTIGVINDHDFNSVQSHMTLIGVGILTQVGQMSKAQFDKLPPDLQEVVLDAGRKTGRFATDIYAKNDNENLTTLVDKGMRIIEITPEERQTWIQAAQPAVEWMSNQIGQELTQRFFSEIEKYRK